MAFLDFINKRNSARQQSVANKSQEQNPETAKEMYTRQAVQEKAKLTPKDQMPPEQQAKLESIKQTLQKATQHRGPSNEPTSPPPAGGTGNPEPMRQAMTGQDKTAPGLSPTSAQTGTTAVEKDSPAPSTRVETKTPAKGASRAPQTLPRTRPSWER